MSSVNGNFGQLVAPGFIDLHRTRQFEVGTRIGIGQIVDVFQNMGISTDSDVDFIRIMYHLKRFQGLTDDQAMEALRVTNQQTGSKALASFLKYVLERVSVENVYLSFCGSGYGDLFTLWMCLKEEGIVMPQKTEIPQNDYLYQYYYTLKRCVDNRCFKGNIRQMMACLNRKVTLRLRNCLKPEKETEPDSKNQRNLSQMVAVKLNLVQLYGPTEAAKRHKIIVDMSETRTMGLDRRVVELTCHSKLAVTASRRNSIEEAEKHIRETLVLCDRCLPSFATVMALNDVMYAYQELFFRSGNQRQDWFERSTDICAQFTYHLMCCEMSEAQVQWKRIALLFKAMSYLNISHEFEVTPIESVSAGSLEKADIVIKEVEKLEHLIEIRREMVLNLCRARLLEGKDKQLALAYIEKAAAVIDEGCLRDTEKVNLQSYVNLLRTEA